MNIPPTFKEHPYLWGGGALVLFLLIYYMFSGSSSSSSSSTASDLSSYYAAAAAAAQSGNQLQAAQAANTAAQGLATTQAGVDLANISAAEKVGLAGIAGATQSSVAQTNAAKAETLSTNSLNKLFVNAQAKIGLVNSNNALKATQNTNEAAVKISGQQVTGATKVAAGQTAAAVALNKENTSTTLSLARLPYTASAANEIESLALLAKTGSLPSGYGAYGGAFGGPSAQQTASNWNNIANIKFIGPNATRSTVSTFKATATKSKKKVA